MTDTGPALLLLVEDDETTRRAVARQPRAATAIASTEHADGEARAARLGAGHDRT